MAATTTSTSTAKAPMKILNPASPPLRVSFIYWVFT